MTTSGLQLNFGNDGSVKVKKGRSAHRNEYIKLKLDQRDFKGLDKIFFQDPVPGYNNESTMDEMYIEGQLMTRYIKLLKEDER